MTRSKQAPAPLSPTPGVPCLYRVHDWMDRSDHWCHGEVVGEHVDDAGARYLRVRSGWGELAYRPEADVRVETT